MLIESAKKNEIIDTLAKRITDLTLRIHEEKTFVIDILNAIPKEYQRDPSLFRKLKKNFFPNPKSGKVNVSGIQKQESNKASVRYMFDDRNSSGTIYIYINIYKSCYHQ